MLEYLQFTAQFLMLPEDCKQTLPLRNYLFFLKNILKFKRWVKTAQNIYSKYTENAARDGAARKLS